MEKISKLNALIIFKKKLFIKINLATRTENGKLLSFFLPVRTKLA
jgi:hypothetical protein